MARGFDPILVAPGMQRLFATEVFNATTGELEVWTWNVRKALSPCSSEWPYMS
jgi:hypothetical protein